MFLDIGAYIGLYSLVAAKIGTFEEIHAVEPIPDNYKRLEWHINNNGYDKTIVPHNVATSDSNGSKKFHSNLSNSMIVGDADESESITLPCARLDDLFDYKGKRIAVKMDVELHELPSIRGAEKLFSNNDIFLQVEIIKGNEKVIDYLCNNGFELLHRLSTDFYLRRAATTTNS